MNKLTEKEIFLAKSYQEQADELNAAGMWTTGEDGQPRPMTAEDAKSRPEFAPEAYEDYGDIDPKVIRECQAKINAEYGIDQGGWEPVGDTITRAPQISIRHKVADGFVQFDCERIGVIDLEKRYRRQKAGVHGAESGCFDRVLGLAIEIGDLGLAEAALRIMRGVSVDMGDYDLNDIQLGFNRTEAYSMEIFESGPSGRPEHTSGSAFIVGHVGLVKHQDQIIVCRVTDAAVLSNSTTTCTPEESRLLEECNANALERVKFAEYVIRNGSLAGALFAALGDY